MEFITAIVGLLGSLIAGGLAAFIARRQQQQTRLTRSELQLQREELRRRAEDIAGLRIPRDSGAAEALSSWQAELLARLSQSKGLDRREIQKQISAEIEELEQRLARVEARFPAEAQLDKIASINDAILSERIEQLGKRIDGLETRTLSRWDIALVVSAVIGAIFAVVAATYGVISFLEGG